MSYALRLAGAGVVIVAAAFLAVAIISFFVPPIRAFLAAGRKQRACPHPMERQRCIHGDEINMAGGNRGRCRDCGKLLPDLPLLCSVSGQPH